MKKMKYFILLFILSFLPNASAWENDSTWDRETMTLPGSTALPSNCHDKQVFVDTDATSGQRFYLCESGTWVAQGGGGAVGGGWTDGGTNIYNTTASDNVGIGTSLTSAGKLTIKGAGTTTGVGLQTQSSGGTAQFTVLDNSQVAIGAAGAAADTTVLLTINGTQRARQAGSSRYRSDWAVAIGKVFFGAYDDTGATYIPFLLDASEFKFNTGTGGVALALEIISNGNVGVGTSIPQGKLVVKGGGITTAPNLILEDSAAAVKVTVLDNGNVGLGTTAPEGNFIVRTANDIGWTPKSAANQACNTTCVSGCVAGWDTLSVAPLLCTDATSDYCLCSGSD